MKKSRKVLSCLIAFIMVFAAFGPVSLINAAENTYGVFSGVQDIGTVGKPGSMSFENGVYTLKSSGDNIWMNADSVTMAYKEVTGDVEISCRVLSIEDTSQFAKIGVSIREKLNADSKHMYIGFKPKLGLETVWRPFEKGQSRAEGDELTSYPCWIKLSRYKDTFTVWYSENGDKWEKLTGLDMKFNDTVYVGLVCCSNDRSKVTTGKVDNVKVSQEVAPPPEPKKSTSTVKPNNDMPDASKKIAYKSSWLGNTYGYGESKQWVQNDVHGMYVSPNGTLYTNSVYDEAGRDDGVYSTDGKPLFSVAASGEPANAVIYDSVNGMLYISKGSSVYFYKITDKPEYLIRMSAGSGDVEGLALYKNMLFASTSAGNIVGWDTSTRKKLSVKWKVDGAGRMVVDKAGTLWIVQKTTKKVLRYSVEGKLLKESITGLEDPNAVAVDPSGKLIVADNGSRYQVLYYDISGTPKLVNTIGVKGGTYAGTTPGLVAPDRFDNIVGVGADKNGNLYVAMNSPHTIIRKFSPSLKMQWQLVSLCFVDAFDFDPASDGKDIYGVKTHVKMDYSKTKPGTEWSWYSSTYDMKKYRNDGRFDGFPRPADATTPDMARMDGRLFMFVTGMHSKNLAIYRFDGEIAVPSSYISPNPIGWSDMKPEKGRWIWRDISGDGNYQKDEYEADGVRNPGFSEFCVDKNGDIWVALGSKGVGHFKYKGLDSKGNPIYSYKDGDYEEFPLPDEFEEINRLDYDSDTDTMIIGGYSVDLPRPAGESGLIGSEIARYNTWKAGRKLIWRTAIPHTVESANTQSSVGGGAVSPLCLEAAGDMVFVGYVNSGGEHLKGTKPPIAVYSAKNGKYIGVLRPDANVGSTSGWLDLSGAVNAIKRSNGDYVVLAEEDFAGKNIIYFIPAAEAKRALASVEK